MVAINGVTAGSISKFVEESVKLLNFVMCVKESMISPVKKIKSGLNALA